MSATTVRNACRAISFIARGCGRVASTCAGSVIIQRRKGNLPAAVHAVERPPHDGGRPDAEPREIARRVQQAACRPAEPAEGDQEIERTDRNAEMRARIGQHGSAQRMHTLRGGAPSFDGFPRPHARAKSVHGCIEKRLATSFGGRDSTRTGTSRSRCSSGRGAGRCSVSQPSTDRSLVGGRRAGLKPAPTKRQTSMYGGRLCDRRSAL